MTIKHKARGLLSNLGIKTASRIPFVFQTKN